MQIIFLIHIVAHIHRLYVLKESFVFCDHVTFLIKTIETSKLLSFPARKHPPLLFTSIKLLNFRILFSFRALILYFLPNDRHYLYCVIRKRDRSDRIIWSCFCLFFIFIVLRAVDLDMLRTLKHNNKRRHIFVVAKRSFWCGKWNLAQEVFNVARASTTSAIEENK